MREPNAKCEVCNKKYYRSPSQLLKSKTNCCSRGCSATLRSEWMKAEGNHQFGLKGSTNSSYLRDYKISSYGYLLLRDTLHPLCMSDGFVFAHRLVVESHLIENDPGSDYLIDLDGRLVLDPGLIVHHKDENKLNNSLYNLEVTGRSEHQTNHNLNRFIYRNPDGTFCSAKTRLISGYTTKAHSFDAGNDILSDESIVIRPGERYLICTNLRVSIPEGCVGLIWARSGLAVKHGISVGAGCIDSGYSGECKVLLFNHGDKIFRVSKGDRVAQMLIVPIDICPISETTEDLEETTRGSDGFGSSGV